jgi:nucleoside-diphosphate-sugar epimerase
VLNRGQTQAAFPHGVRKLAGDRDNADSMREALAGGEWDVAYDVSGYTLQHVQTVVELLSGRVAHYIFASSTVIYAAARLMPLRETSAEDDSPRQNDYGRNKIACERYLFAQHREHGFPASTVPFSMVFGPHNIVPDREQRMFKRLLLGRPVLIPGDGTSIGMVGHVDDQARALRMMALKPSTFGKRYNVSGQDCYTDDGYVDVIADVVGITPRRVSVPPEVMDELWKAKGLDLHRAAHLVQKVAPHLHHWNSSFWVSSDRLRQDTGWEPDYTFPAMVAQTYEWYRREGVDAVEFDFSFEDALLERLGA